MHKLFNQFECSNFIMPEHNNALKEYYREREREEKHVPVYDQQEFDLWESLIRQSKSSGCIIKITTNDPAETFSGSVTELNPRAKP